MATNANVADSTFLGSSNPAQVKRNVLAGFTKALLLPVTVVPKAAAYSFNAVAQAGAGAFNAVAQVGAGIGAGLAGAPAGYSSRLPRDETGKWLVTPDEPDDLLIVDQVVPHANNDQTSGSMSVPSSSLAVPSSSSAFSSPRPSSVASTASSTRFERLQLLLSLDTALQLIQSDRECLKRVQTFIGYPGACGRKVRDTMEEVFIVLLQSLGEKHIVPAFNQCVPSSPSRVTVLLYVNLWLADSGACFPAARASIHMSLWQPDERGGDDNVAPLVQFFELVHIGDTIQQMVQVFFDKEMVRNRPFFLKQSNPRCDLTPSKPKGQLH
jgi:recyclin-1